MVELFTNFKFRNTNNTCTLIDSYRWFNCRKTIKLQKTLIKTAENRTPFSVFFYSAECREPNSVPGDFHQQ